MRVIVLNDMPWAVSSNTQHTDEQLAAWGAEECRKRYWLPACDYEPGTMTLSHVVYVNIQRVKDVSRRV